MAWSKGVLVIAIRARIGTKIFALAAGLLLLNLGVSVFASWQSRSLRRGLLAEIAFDIPLQSHILALNEHALQRRIEYERWRAEIEKHGMHSQSLAARVEGFKYYDDLVADDFSQIIKLIDANDPKDPAIAHLRALVVGFYRDSALTVGIQRRVLKALLSNSPALTDDIAAIQDSIQKNLQSQREDITKSVEALSLRAALAAERQEQSLITTVGVVTVCGILLGLGFAWWMTRRMVAPVKALVCGVESLERGNFGVKLLVESTDEIGLLTHSFNSLAEELQSKETLKATFGKYLDPRIVENVILNPTVSEPEGGRRVMTVSFCDLVGFAEIGEQLTPSGLVRLLNRHFALMADAIHEYHGVLDKLIGDAVMAYWGPPFCTREEHAQFACLAALQQTALCEVFRAELPELTGLRKHLPAIDLRIGLAAGEVVVGNIGAERAQSYTVIGDTVNLASRLESVNRTYGTKILVNREVAGLVADTLELREVDAISVKGKRESDRIYELLGTRGNVPTDRLRLRDTYTEALGAYRNLDLSGAIQLFNAALEIFPQDGPSQVLLDRARQFQRVPPPPHWDAVWHLPEK